MTIPRKHILEHLEMHGFTDFIILGVRQSDEPADEFYPGQVEVSSTLTDNGLIEDIMTQSSGTMKANWIKQSALLH